MMWKKALHSLLVGLGSSILVAIGGVFDKTDPSSFTHDPTLIALLGVGVAGLTRLIGYLVSKTD